MAIQLLPTCPTQPETIACIDAAIELIKQTGLSYEVGPLETTIEGDSIDELLTLVSSIKAQCDNLAVDELIMMIKILSKKTGVMSIAEKTQKHK